MSTGEINDAKLVDAAQNGDIVAFDKLVLKYQDRVFNICLKFLGNWEDAKDAAQEVFVNAFEGISKFKKDAGFYTWLYRITRNTVFSKRRAFAIRQKKEIAVGDLTTTKDNSFDSAPILEKTEFEPEERALEKEKSQLITQAITTLEPELSEIVVLKDIEGYSYKEIAQMVDYPVGTIKSRLCKARLKLRNLLKGRI